jgi:hypothetical protein
MLELTGNIWDLDGDGLCITTNRIVKEDGRAVMGAGIAKQCLERYPGVDKVLAYHIQEWPNNLITTLVIDFVRQQRIISFPTKYDWRDDSDLKLIVKSANQLMDYIKWNKLGEVLLPRPGVGMGNLDWEVVKATIAPILDDRVIVVAYA